MIAFAATLELSDVLTLLSQDIATLDWQLEAVECAGDPQAARLLEYWSDVGRTVTTDELVKAAPGAQVIDGIFVAPTDGDSTTLIKLQARDGTVWELSASAEVEARVSRSVPLIDMEG